ncbi:MAG TPA: peroxiredoxin [Candidatus Woesebacteria bacterium]|nr:peroxiredoxin [Candidatus Woesebacteria bacterium]HNS95106.1 peroxiredoxin [Candidatus Woesebacteria bacterium]
MYTAHSFSLPDQDGKVHTLSDYAGKWLVLYFYPKDDTPGCTVEACSFRDNTAELARLNAVVLGVSKDTIQSHQKFASKHKLNFPLLADTTGEVCKAYGVLKEKSMFGNKYMGVSRDTFLINPEGQVFKEYRGVNPLTHWSEIQKDLAKE